MSTIRFIGHTGEITALARLPKKSMFVLDSNTVISFLRHVDHQTRLDEPHFRLLRETRRRVHCQWTKRAKFIPVEPVLALMELTRQDCEPDYPKYLLKFEHFFRAVYGVSNYDPTWVRLTYEPIYRLVSSVHQSLRETLQQIQALAPISGKLDHEMILKRIDEFLDWVFAEREKMAVIGGPLLHLAVYAIAGSPDAHRFLKLARVAKDGGAPVSRNVAWDLVHWVNLDFHYHYAKYPSTVVCTSDQALADFLLIRRNIGPRVGARELLSAHAVNSYGNLNLPKLSKLDETPLGDEIARRILAFWQRLSQRSAGEMWLGPFE